MISFERVCKSYSTPTGRRVVLDDVSAVFAPGRNLGILGVNGAGKSTLLRLIAGTEMPDKGRVTRYGRVSFPLGFSGTFHGALSGRENVAFVARVYGASLRRTIAYVRDFAELADYFEMPVNTYSSGMRARLAFGLCLAIDFDVYLIDEATEVGDERFRRRCVAAFQERVARSDIILVTHNARTVRQYCDQGAVLTEGRLRLFDDLNAAFAHYHGIVAEAA